MDERAIKRLLVIVALSIIAIFLFRSMLLKTVTRLNSAAAIKKQAAAPAPAPQQEETPVAEMTSVIAAASAPAEAATLEPAAASGVSEGRTMSAPQHEAVI